MPTQRAFPAAVAIGTSIYVVGGLHPAGDRDPRAALNVVEEFDITSKNWRRRADMPTPRSRLAAVAAGGKILAIAGLGARGDVSVTEIYDPANDRWEPGPALPLARHGHSAVNVDGVVFVLGGYATSDGVMAPQSRVDALNLSSRQWERRADLPTARGFLAAVTWGQWIYAIGGRIASGAVERYRVPANTWEVLADMPAPRQRFGAAVVDGRIIAVGGESQGSREAIRYDPRCERPSPKPGR
jgi:N-acetylneuraminic acid mutarotase